MLAKEILLNKEYTDLERVKNGDTTVFFGKSMYQNSKHRNYIVLDNDLWEKIYNIDKKIGYTTEMNILQKLKELLINIKKGNFDIQKLTGIECFYMIMNIPIIYLLLIYLSRKYLWMN